MPGEVDQFAHDGDELVAHGPVGNLVQIAEKIVFDRSQRDA
jgi:hypothetical protein